MAEKRKKSPCTSANMTLRELGYDQRYGKELILYTSRKVL